MLVGLTGVLIALTVPFAPIFQQQTVVTWPAPNEPVASSTALFVPYRPATLTATVPCAAIRAAEGRAGTVTVLATGRDGDGLLVRTGTSGTELLLDDRTISLDRPLSTSADCQIVVSAGPDGTTVTEADGRATLLAGEPVPPVFAFRTDLDAAQAAGMSVQASIASPFATSPSGLKVVLVTAQVLAVLLALSLLGLAGRRARPPPGPDEQRVQRGSRWRTGWVDAAVTAVLVGWAIIGPLAVDDGWAATIARTFAATGNAGNYYRWWNASETPFALSHELLAPLTEVSLAPLWLRLPSTLMAVATWFVLSRGVLGSALGSIASTARIRVLAAVCLLVAWLPFNLGVRPESYVALGVTSVLALLWRARRPATLGCAALLTAVTITISPTAVVVAAPILVFAPRIVTILRSAARGRTELAAYVALLCCIGSVSLTVIFADQTWNGLSTATDWHTSFGPTLPWYHEPDRYGYLLGEGQQGSAFKRIPVLLTLAMLPIIGLLWRRRDRDEVARSAVRLGAVVLLALALLCLVPSKWSYHLGSLAGFFAAFLVVALVVLLRRAREPIGDRRTGIAVVAGGVLVAAAAALAFTGSNAWWIPTVYDVAWATGPVRALGLPLDSTLFWAGVLVVIVAVSAGLARLRGPRRIGPALIAAPAVLTLAAAGTALAVLVGSFVAAPLRRREGSLALANLHELSGRSRCGLADDIEVLPDRDPLALADMSAKLTGFSALAGFYPGAPPPDPPGIRTSAELWGSWVGGPQNTGTMTSPWFTLPRLGPAEGVAVSVSGRTDGANSLVLSFGRATDAGVTTLADRTPIDQVASDEDPAHPLWRSIGVDAADVPADADRVRIRAVDGRTDPQGWLAVTGPRLRSVVGLTEFLATRGPVLVTWPMSFLFPCIRDIPGVDAGLAETPGAVIEANRPRFAEDRDKDIGGTFAGLVPFGQLYEVPTRLVGHADVDWGALLLSGDKDARDSYQRSTVGVRRSGSATLDVPMSSTMSDGPTH